MEEPIRNECHVRFTFILDALGRIEKRLNNGIGDRLASLSVIVRIQGALLFLILAAIVGMFFKG